MMPASILDCAVQDLLVQSLAAWHVGGVVAREADGALLITAGDKRLRVSRAPADLPFRWMVGRAQAQRGATSIVCLPANVRPRWILVIGRCLHAPLPLVPS
jgi:hypothetical protein